MSLVLVQWNISASNDDLRAISDCFLGTVNTEWNMPDWKTLNISTNIRLWQIHSKSVIMNRRCRSKFFTSLKVLPLNSVKLWMDCGGLRRQTERNSYQSWSVRFSTNLFIAPHPCGKFKGNLSGLFIPSHARACSAVSNPAGRRTHWRTRLIVSTAVCLFFN